MSSSKFVLQTNDTRHSGGGFFIGRPTCTRTSRRIGSTSSDFRAFLAFASSILRPCLAQRISFGPLLTSGRISLAITFVLRIFLALALGTFLSAVSLALSGNVTGSRGWPSSRETNGLAYRGTVEFDRMTGAWFDQLAAIFDSGPIASHSGSCHPIAVLFAIAIEPKGFVVDTSIPCIGIRRQTQRNGSRKFGRRRSAWTFRW